MLYLYHNTIDQVGSFRKQTDTTVTLQAATQLNTTYNACDFGKLSIGELIGPMPVFGSEKKHWKSICSFVPLRGEGRHWTWSYVLKNVRLLRSSYLHITEYSATCICRANKQALMLTASLRCCDKVFGCNVVGEWEAAKYQGSFGQQSSPKLKGSSAPHAVTTEYHQVRAWHDNSWLWRQQPLLFPHRSFSKSFPQLAFPTNYVCGTGTQIPGSGSTALVTSCEFQPKLQPW